MRSCSSRIACLLLVLTIVIVATRTAYSVPFNGNLSSTKATVNTRVFGKVRFKGGFKIGDIKIAESKLILIEEFQPRLPPLPAGFQDWEQEKRDTWYRNWTASAAGKNFQSAEEKRFAALKKHETKMDNDLSFRMMGVKNGKYDLGGEIIFTHRGKKYFGEFYAKVIVSDVDQVELDRIEVQPRRMLQTGEAAPRLKLTSIDGKQIDTSKSGGANRLIIFWSSFNPAAPQLIDQLKELKKSDGKRLQIISVGFDVESKTFTDFVTEKSIPGRHAHQEKFDSEMTQSYGIEALPSIWLLDRNGKILATATEFRKNGMKLKSIVSGRSGV